MADLRNQVPLHRRADHEAERDAEADGGHGLVVSLLREQTLVVLFVP